jgi:hypothetical protein
MARGAEVDRPPSGVALAFASALCCSFACASAGPGRAPAPPVAADPAACERSDAEACAREGRRLGAPDAASAEDLARALPFYDRACTLGSDDGCTALSYLYAQGRGVAVDRAKAVAIVRASCDRGRPGSCAVLGSYLSDGLQGQRDEAAARALCLDGPPRARGLWCTLYGIDIDQERAPGGPELILQFYRRACSKEVDLGCVPLAAALFRFGRREEGLALGERLCAGGAERACSDLKQLRAMVFREQRDGGGPPGTPLGPMHLRVPADGVAYDPPGDKWGTGVPTHEAGPQMTVWRWWRPSTQIEVSLLRELPAAARPAGRAGLTAMLEDIARLTVAGLADGARVESGPDVLAGRPCGHAWFNTGLSGRGDFFVMFVGQKVYALLVLQNSVFDPHLLERAKAGLRIDAGKAPSQRRE